MIVWLAVKLFTDVTSEEDADREAGTIWQAIKIIVIADVTMSWTIYWGWQRPHEATRSC